MIDRNNALVVIRGISWEFYKIMESYMEFMGILWYHVASSDD